MNFVGHIHVARVSASSDVGSSSGSNSDSKSDSKSDSDRANDSGYLIGSALPDVASMGRFRLTEPPASQSVEAGIALHHRTDDAFHGHQWFRRHSQAVTRQLEHAGLVRGAAMACGHVGVELLLDGHLLDENPELRNSVQAAMTSIVKAEHGLADVVVADRRQDWQVHLDRFANWTLPDDYNSPDAVAERLRRILARRRRLAFPYEQVGLVAEVLRRRQPILESGSQQLIDDLRAAMSSE